MAPAARPSDLEAPVRPLLCDAANSEGPPPDAGRRGRLRLLSHPAVGPSDVQRGRLIQPFCQRLLFSRQLRGVNAGFSSSARLRLRIAAANSSTIFWTRAMEQLRPSGNCTRRVTVRFQPQLAREGPTLPRAHDGQPRALHRLAARAGRPNRPQRTDFASDLNAR